MPLQHSGSQKAFTHNLKAEMHAGKPQKQSLAIAYSLMKKAKKEKMAAGGEVKGVHESDIGDDRKDPKWMLGQSKAGSMVEDEKPEHAKGEHRRILEEMRSMKKPSLYAKGGFVEEEEASGYGEMPCEMCEDGQCYEHGGMVDRIMNKRKYSEGGMIANQEHGEDDNEMADFSPNEFDDLVKDDELESSYTGANSGDELGNGRESEDERDTVSRIMRSRKLKDRMPRPA